MPNATPTSSTRHRAVAPCACVLSTAACRFCPALRTRSSSAGSAPETSARLRRSTVATAGRSSRTRGACCAGRSTTPRTWCRTCSRPRIARCASRSNRSRCVRGLPPHAQPRDRRDPPRAARRGRALGRARRRRRGDPAAVLSRRQELHALVADIAELPERQRAALLARVVDGTSAEQIGGALGLSTAATQMLIVRARDGLVKVRARATPSARTSASSSRSRANAAYAPLSTRAATRSGCPACAAYSRDLKQPVRRSAASSAHLAAAASLLGGKLAGGAAGSSWPAVPWRPSSSQARASPCSTPRPERRRPGSVRPARGRTVRGEPGQGASD